MCLSPPIFIFNLDLSTTSLIAYAMCYTAIAIAYSCPKLLATYTKIITSLKEQKCQTVQFDLFWFFYRLRTDSVQQLVGCPIQYCLQSLI